jgi:MFS transporter, PAT family, solute carrier family 33 (acetyl-CoA transportor), member 1
VDALTTATCHPGEQKAEVHLKGPLVTSPFSCAIQADKERCENGGGTCEMIRDGYYLVNIICVVIGIVTFVGFIRPKVLHLQALPLRAWRLGGPAAK